MSPDIKTCTDAERTGALYDHDGQVFDRLTRYGIPRTIGDDCIARSRLSVNSEGDERYVFPDDSVLIVSSAAWDYGLRDRECFCWYGDDGKHSEECDERNDND